jgi:class 3 adenylate cyclase
VYSTAINSEHPPNATDVFGGSEVEQKTQSKILRERLENATGKPEHVIAVNLDIRGFSSFCERNESANVVTYIREACKNLIDRHFPQAPFIKMTGDGLLIVSPCEKGSLDEDANYALNACQKVHESFPSLVDDPMVNIKKPQKIGIGLSRGAAFRIVANGGTLDYSGRVLNLASRLMNLARPSGIVFDCEFLNGITAPSDLEKTFSKSKVWLWGIAESDPIEIYYSKAYGTSVPAMYRKRLDVRKWMTEEGSWSFENIESKAKNNLRIVFILDREPRDAGEIIVKVEYPPDMASKLDSAGYVLPGEFFQYLFVGGEPKVAIRSGLLVGRLRQLGFMSKHRCVFVFKYPR